MRWLDGITNLMDMNLCKFLELVIDRDTWHAAVHWISKCWTQLRDCTELMGYISSLPSQMCVCVCVCVYTLFFSSLKYRLSQDFGFAGLTHYAQYYTQYPLSTQQCYVIMQSTASFFDSPLTQTYNSLQADENQLQRQLLIPCDI